MHNYFLGNSDDTIVIVESSLKFDVQIENQRKVGNNFHTFTLDTNCIIDIEEDRADAGSVKELVKSHKLGLADVAIVAIAASETQVDGSNLGNISAFLMRLKNLGLDGLNILLPMAYTGVSYFNYAILSGPDESALEGAIHRILFPHVSLNLGAIAPDTKARRKWLNAKCDVQTYWAHVYKRREIFVTSDENFHKRSKRPQLIGINPAPSQILKPTEALALL